MMADEELQIDDQEDELILDDEVDSAPPADEDSPAEPEAGEEEFAIELEGDEPEEEGTPLVRDLRQQLRSAQKELSEHRRASQPKIEVGKKPDLWEDCDGDPDKFEAELTAWNDRKRKAEEQDREAERAVEVRNQDYQRRFVNYRAKAAQLPVKDFEDAEKAVIAALPELLQSAVVSYADDPAKVVYALAKHPARLAALAQEADPIKFVLAMKDLERNLKVVNRKRPPSPEAETVQQGSAQLSGGDKQEKKLEAEAARSGDRSKLIAYRAAKRAA